MTMSLPRPLTPPTSAVTWRSWHLHLASPARTYADRVLREAVAPVVDPLQGRPWFFIRFWQRGPHLRLRVGDLTATEAAELGDDLAARLDAVPRDRGIEPPVCAATYATDAARMAAAESGPDRAVQPMRSPGVHPDRYHPEVDRYGGPGPLARSETLFGLSSRLVLAALARPHSAGARAAVARQATRAAAFAMAEPDDHTDRDPAIFLAFGRQAWRDQGLAHGYSPDLLDAWSRLPESAALLPGGHGAFQTWHQGLRELAAQVRRGSAQHPGAVLSAHVHMLHNRLGLGLPEELRSYALLSAAHPVAAAPRTGGLR